MSDLFAHFGPLISAAHEKDIRLDPTLAGKLTIESDGAFSAFYAPFEHIQLGARVVIVGITPGLQQATNALLEARRQLLAGKDPSTSLAAAKVFASFSGAMRTNLVEMLDFIGLAKWCGLPSTDQLWTTRSDLAHFTSALRYPVLFKGGNYGGTPPIDSVPLLRGIVKEHLAQEAEALQEAVWIPLGPSVSAALDILVKGGVMDPALVLNGLPHPSPASIERIRYFLGRKPREQLSAKTNPYKLDKAREMLLVKVAGLPPMR